MKQQLRNRTPLRTSSSESPFLARGFESLVMLSRAEKHRMNLSHFEISFAGIDGLSSLKLDRVCTFCGRRRTGASLEFCLLTTEESYWLFWFIAFLLFASCLALRQSTPVAPSTVNANAKKMIRTMRAPVSNSRTLRFPTFDSTKIMFASSMLVCGSKPLTSSNRFGIAALKAVTKKGLNSIKSST